MKILGDHPKRVVAVFTQVYIYIGECKTLCICVQRHNSTFLHLRKVFPS